MDIPVQHRQRWSLPFLHSNLTTACYVDTFTNNLPHRSMMNSMHDEQYLVLPLLLSLPLPLPYSRIPSVAKALGRGSAGPAHSQIGRSSSSVDKKQGNFSCKAGKAGKAGWKEQVKSTLSVYGGSEWIVVGHSGSGGWFPNAGPECRYFMLYYVARVAYYQCVYSGG